MTKISDGPWSKPGLGFAERAGLLWEYVCGSMAPEARADLPAIAAAFVAVRRETLREAAALCRRLELAAGGRGADGDDCAAAIERLGDADG